MKAEVPATGILKTHDWGYSKFYNVQCQCSNPDCAHDVEVEADDTGITVSVYSKQTTRWWTLGRFRQIWEILIKGYSTNQAVLCLDKQQALNYAKTLESAITDVEEFQRERT